MGGVNTVENSRSLRCLILRLQDVDPRPSTGTLLPFVKRFNPAPVQPLMPYTGTRSTCQNFSEYLELEREAKIPYLVYL